MAFSHSQGHKPPNRRPTASFRSTLVSRHAAIPRQRKAMGLQYERQKAPDHAGALECPNDQYFGKMGTAELVVQTPGCGATWFPN